MGILDQAGITGVSPSKKHKQPTARGGLNFDKTQPITPYNRPLQNYTHWKAFGYMINSAGIKRPHWIEKTLPQGHPFVPDLDEVVSCHGTPFGKMIPAKKENNFIPDF